MATRRSSRILTTTIEVCPDSDADEPENRSSNKVEQSKTPSGKQSDRCSSRLKVLQEVSKTAPRKQRRVMGTEREGPKRLVPADLWTKAMKKDDALARYIEEREKLDEMIDETELSIIEDNSERLNTTI